MVTLKDIAAAADVSVVTASHILGSRAENFRPKTRERVYQAAKSLGYRANASAKAMRSGRFNCFSLLLSADPAYSGFFPPLIDGITSAAEEQGQQLMIHRVSDRNLTDAEYVPLLLRESASDGLLVIYNVSLPDGIRNLMAQCNIPAIWINSRQDGDCVYPDERDGSRRATEHLLELGHRDIAYLDYTFGSDYPHIHYHLGERYIGYEVAMREAGLSPLRLDAVSNVPRTERMAHATAWLKSPACPTAIVTRAPSTAWPILCAATMLGLQIPRDLSIITFGEKVPDETGLAVDTMLQPMRDMGREAVQMLMRKVAAPDQTMAPVILPMQYLAGQTCGRPAQRT